MENHPPNQPQQKYIPAPTDVLVENAIPHLVGGRLSLKGSLAGQPPEFEVPGNGRKSYGFKFQGRLAGILRVDFPGVMNRAVLPSRVNVF